MEWDGRDRRKGLTDEQKREIWAVFEQRVGRGTLSALGRICWTLGSAGVGYVVAQAEKWFK